MRNLWFRTVCAAVCLTVLLGATGLLAGLREAAAAGATRVAVVTSLKGDVQVKKSGGAKFFSAFKNMSLNEGDLITTGKNSSVVLELASSKADQDSITIGENSQVQFTKLKEDTGAKAKMSVWAGSLWVKVKSISNADDTFEVETPTAIMGVRGTHFILKVDPYTGQVIIVVASGVVASSKTNGSGTGFGPNDPVHIYPSQQLELYPDAPTDDTRTLIDLADPSTLVLTLPADIVDAMVTNMAEIMRENEQLAQQLAGSVEQGITAPDPNANLLLLSGEDVAAYAENINALLVVTLAEAVNRGILPEETARSIIDQINDIVEKPEKRYSLENVPEYRKDIGTDPALAEERERARKEQEEKQREKEQRRQEQLEKNREKAEQIAEKKSELEQKNQEAKSEREKEAVDKYKQSLSEEERTQLEQRQREREREKQEQQQGGGNADPGAGGPSPGPGAGTSGPSVAAAVSDYSDWVKTIDIRLSGFTGSRAVFGYQADVKYDPQYFGFAESVFMDTNGLNPFRNLADSPFKVELAEGWTAPDGYNVNAVDHVEHDTENYIVRYAVLKFEGGAEEVNGQTVVRLPFQYASIPDTNQTAVFTITLTAVDGNGNAISGLKPVTVQVVVNAGPAQPA